MLQSAAWPRGRSFPRQKCERRRSSGWQSVQKKELTLKRSLLGLFIKSQEKQGAGQIDPNLSWTLRIGGEGLVLLSGHQRKYSEHRYLSSASGVLYLPSYTQWFRWTHAQHNYLHSSLVIPQVEGTVADPEVCILLFLTDTSLEL